MKTFEQFYIAKSIREQAGPAQGVAPGLGNLDGQSQVDQQPDTAMSETRKAFQDISPVLEKAMSYPSGKALIAAIVDAVMNNDQVPDNIKRELKAKIGGRWASVVDINQSGTPGRGPGLANASPLARANMPSQGYGNIDPMASSSF